MQNRFKLDIKKNGWLWTIIIFALSSALTVFLVQWLLLDLELFAKTTFFKLFLNALCVLVVHLIALFFTNRTSISVMIAHGFFIVLAFINYYVYLFRGNEFFFSDLRAIGTGLSVAGKYKFELNEKCVFVIAISLLLCIIVSRFQISFKNKLHMRLIIGLSAVLAVIIVMLNTYDANTETWEQKGTYKNGYVLNFILSARDSFVFAPEGYSLESITKLEQAYESGSQNTAVDSYEEEPTIIVIMSESFADLSVIGEFETNEPLTPFYDSLEENTIKGYALTSVYGAKTPNSEWEFLTGGSMAFLPEGSVVYQQYINDTPTSLVSTLKNEGYTCVSMHPYYETGWSRDLIYPTFGFDESYFIEDFDQTQLVREYISDRELYRNIIERYETRGVDENLFIMSISMQNHGGYVKDYENFKENYYKLGRSYTDANQYFSLLRESDEALEELITYFSQVDEPVEIVFFGDHQPGLTSDFYTLLNGKGLSGLTLEELEALYTVPFFIWTNYDTAEETVEITSLNYLSTMALERAGIDLPAYNLFLADLMKVVPAINARGYYSLENERYMYLEAAKGEEAKWLMEYENLQYNGLFDTKNTSEVFFPYLEE